MDTSLQVSATTFADFAAPTEASGFVAAPTVFAGRFGYHAVLVYDSVMRRLKRVDVLFLGCSALFLAHQYLERIAKVRVKVLDNYLDPLLMMPILLYLVTFERRIILRRPDYRLPAMHVAGYVVLVSILAELILPLFNDKLIADPWDVCLYVLGGLIYVLVQAKQRPLKAGRSKI